MIRFPFFNMQELNLDWMMEKLKALLKFIPQNGSAGDVLQRTYDGAVWQPIAAISMDINSLQVISDVQPEDAVPVYDDSAQGNYKALIGDIIALAPVQSVNGQTGDVVLNIPSVPVESVNGQTGDVVLDAADVGALPDSYVAPVTSVNGQTGDVVVTVPSAPVQSVNGQTGAVVLDSASVGAMPDTYVAPVTSVNGQTGDVVISPGGGGAVELTTVWTNPSPGSPFNAQTVTVDLSTYVMVMIEFKAGSTSRQYAVLPIPTTGDYAYISDQFRSAQAHRPVSITSSGIAFENGEMASSYNGAFSTDNSVLIPVRIIGIK